MNIENTQRGKGKMAVGLGLGVAALAAAAAGAYFLYGKDGAKNRKKIQAWSLKMKADVMEKIEKLNDLSEDSYNAVIDQVSRQYAKLKSIDTSELEALTRDLKRHWKNIKRDVLFPADKKKKQR